MTKKSDEHKTETPDVSHIRNEEVTHEYSDVNVSGIFRFAAALTVATIVVCVGMWLLFRYFQAQDAKEPQPGPMALQPYERIPPEPRLQAAPGFGVTLKDGEVIPLGLSEPSAEYKVLRWQWHEALKEGGKDQNGNLVGMPIDDAIKAVVSQLPARTKEAPTKLEDYAISVPTAASSGRMTEKRLQ
ncbi:MAG TPA: hypothetical protein VF074_08885 [Pyrinomonadaceae bacterium]